MYEDPKLIPTEVAKVAVEKLKFARTAPGSYMPLNGCGRVYVMIGFAKLLKSHAIAKELVAAGFKLTPRPGYKGLTVYVGYDNASGRQWTEAHKFAEALKVAGIKAYADVDGD